MPGPELPLILVAATCTFATRAAGPLLGRMLIARPRLERCIDDLSLCLIAALAGSATIGGDLARLAGLAAAVGIRLVTGRTFGAMVAGAGTAGIIRFLLETGS